MIDLAHKLTTIICVGFSSICTYLGFLNEFGPYAAAGVAAMVGLALYTAAIKIGNARQSTNPQERRMRRPVGMLLIAAIISFISNFNFMYTRQVLKEVNSLTMREANAVAKKNYATIQQALDKDDKYVAMSREHEILLNELVGLEFQVTDRRAPGIGKRAQEHIRVIENILGNEFRMTNLKRPPAGKVPAVYGDWATEYAERAKEAYENKRNATHQALIDLETLLKRYREVFASVEGFESDNRNQSSLEVLQQANISLQAAADRALPAANVNLAVAPVDKGRLGTIGYALRNGFIERPYPDQTLIWSGVSLLLDFFPAIFAWFMFDPRRNQSRSAGQGNTSQTRSHTRSHRGGSQFESM